MVNYTLIKQFNSYFTEWNVLVNGNYSNFKPGPCIYLCWCVNDPYFRSPQLAAAIRLQSMESNPLGATPAAMLHPPNVLVFATDRQKGCYFRCLTELLTKIIPTEIGCFVLFFSVTRRTNLVQG